MNNNKIRINNKEYDYVIIDTCTYLRPQFPQFMEYTILHALRASNAKLTVPQAVMREINHFAKEQSDRGAASRKAKKWIQACQLMGYTQTEGNPNSNESADAYILQKVYAARAEGKKLLLISQDATLAKDILASNQTRSGFAPYNNVYRLNKDGFLEEFDTLRFSSNQRNSYQQKNRNDITKVLKSFGL